MIQNPIHIIAHDTSAYWKAVDLRDKILRKPLGLAFTKEELLAENEQIHIVYVQEGKTVASLSLVKCENAKLKMRQVCVDEEFQNQGVGQKIVAFSEEWGRSNGFDLMYCHARDVAKQFYLNMEYTIVGEEFVEVNIPHFKMEKKL